MAIQTAQAVFDGDEDFIDVTWTTPFAGTYYIANGATVPAGTAVTINFKTVTSTGLRVTTSAHFTGTVDLIGYEIIV